MSLNSRIALGKEAWAREGKRETRVVIDSHGRKSEQWRVNGEWVEMKG